MEKNGKEKGSGELTVDKWKANNQERCDTQVQQKKKEAILK